MFPWQQIKVSVEKRLFLVCFTNSIKKDKEKGIVKETIFVENQTTNWNDSVK